MHLNNQPHINCIIGANLGVTNFNFIVDDFRLNCVNWHHQVCKRSIVWWAFCHGAPSCWMKPNSYFPFQSTKSGSAGFPKNGTVTPSLSLSVTALAFRQWRMGFFQFQTRIFYLLSYPPRWNLLDGASFKLNLRNSNEADVRLPLIAESFGGCKRLIWDLCVKCT